MSAKSAAAPTASKATEPPTTKLDDNPLPQVMEVVLPLIMPFLEIRQRVQAQRVCQQWKSLIRDGGIATKIDSLDESLLRLTPQALQGLLTQSFASLECLFLAGMESLEADILHSAIPYWRRLRALDVSKCHQLSDQTLHLLSFHETRRTLKVLYMKGLTKVSDEGILELSRNCKNLRVLELSNIPLTDRGASAVGQHLHKLQALYLRDNYQLTNASVDIITQHCKELEELTLWGLIRLTKLSGFAMSSSPPSSSLLILNLWGCFGLRDEDARHLQGMTRLRSLNVGECHRLTDTFVVSVVEPTVHFRYYYQLMFYCYTG